MSKIYGIPGEIDVNGNIYKGKETKSTTTHVNNFTKEISVNVKDDYLNSTFEITNEDFTVEDDKIIFNSDIAKEIMGMNKRIKADYSLAGTNIEQGQFIAVLSPRTIIDCSSLQDGLFAYEYSTTNWLFGSTTYVEFMFDKNTGQLYLPSTQPAINEYPITGFDGNCSNGIRLTSNDEFSESTINTLQINELNTISFRNYPKLQFTANDKEELESVEFMQDGYSSDFKYTVPKGAKHYVVNELPTTDIDKTGNYYVLTESVDGREFLSTDISNLTNDEYSSMDNGAHRQDAEVNSSDVVPLQTNSIYVDNKYAGDFAIKFNIPCTVEVTLNPRKSSTAVLYPVMYIYVNGVNVMIVDNGIDTYTRVFGVNETLYVRGVGISTDKFYYKLKIRPYTIDGKMPLSTNVDEYINYENIWFKNGGGSNYTAGNGININENVISVDDTIAKKSDIPTNYVTLDTNQTIGGLKRLENILYIGNPTGSEIFIDAKYGKGQLINMYNDELGSAFCMMIDNKYIQGNVGAYFTYEDDKGLREYRLPYQDREGLTTCTLATNLDIHNPTITFTQGGVTKGSISLNQATDQTIALDAGGSGGGSTVVANPTLSGDEATLNGLEVDGVKYAVGGGSGGKLYYHHHVFFYVWSDNYFIINVISSSSIPYTYETLHAYIRNITNGTEYQMQGYQCTFKHGKHCGYSCCASSNGSFYVKNFDDTVSYDIDKSATVTDTITEV